MAFKAALVAMAPGSDPKKHRSSIKTPALELTTVLVEMGNVDQAVEVCKELVSNEGIQDFILCPGFTHQAIAKVVDAVGEKVPVSVARSDIPGVMRTGEILLKEGWLPKGH